MTEPRSTDVIEGVGTNFDLDKMMYVRSLTQRAVHLIAESLSVGMTEGEWNEAAKEILSSMEMRRGWHQIVTRVGENSAKSYSGSDERQVVLGYDDIFLVDIGPIFEDCEGDAGDTFVVGDNPLHHKIKLDVREIWDEVRAKWFETRDSGRQLYDFARASTEARGWTLDLGLTGHRLSDFPHKAHYDGTLAEVDFRPNADLWVLEISIVDPESRFGAFYEDLLLEDQSFPEWALSTSVSVPT
jgi:methionyl aminopeptidase